jgi:DNA-binding LytR/AlgR family response regulator
VYWQEQPIELTTQGHLIEMRSEPQPTPRLLIALSVARGWQLIDVRSIVAVVAEDKYACLVHTDGTRRPVFHTLVDMEGRLECGRRKGELLFFRIHRGHIAAMHHALDLIPNEITMISGLRLPVSRHRSAELYGVLASIR